MQAITVLYDLVAPLQSQVAPTQVARLLVRPENVLKGKLLTPPYAAGLGLRASATVCDWFNERRQCKARAIDRFDESHARLWAAAARDLACAVVRLSGAARDRALLAASWFVTLGDSDVDRPW